MLIHLLIFLSEFRRCKSKSFEISDAGIRILKNKIETDFVQFSDLSAYEYLPADDRFWVRGVRKDKFRLVIDFGKLEKNLSEELAGIFIAKNLKKIDSKNLHE